MAATTAAAPVVVLGSTGNIGQATIKALSAKGIATRAGVRDTSSDKASALAALEHISTVTADLGKPETLSAAMTGASAAFIITPPVENRPELVGVGVEAAKAAGVGHIVVVSLPCVRGGIDGLFKRQFTAVEELVKASGLNYTLLRLPMFMENQFGNMGSIKGEGKIYGPADGSKPFTAASVDDIGAAAASVLASVGDYVNATIEVAAATSTFNDIASYFSEATGREVSYVQVPYDAALASMTGAGWPEWQAAGVLDLLRLIDADDAGAISETADTERVLGRAATTFKEWVLRVGGAFKADE